MKERERDRQMGKREREREKEGGEKRVGMSRQSDGHVVSRPLAVGWLQRFRPNQRPRRNEERSKVRSAGEATEWFSSPWIEWWSGRFGDRRMEEEKTPREPDRPGRNDGWTGSGPLVLRLDQHSLSLYERSQTETTK